MPNLPSWLSSIVSSSVPPQKDEEKNDAENLFNPDNAVPKDAPQLIKDMARNISDILQNIHKIRGERQSLITCAILTIAQNGFEVEKLACACIQDNEHAHDMMHVYHTSISDALHRLVKLLESEGEFNGLGDDMNIICNRIHDDYHSKLWNLSQNPEQNPEQDEDDKDA